MATEFSNGTTIPHADGYEDLLDKLKTFLTTNADLVSSSIQWTSLKDNGTGAGRELYLMGPGSAQSDEIHVNIRLVENVATTAYNWEVRSAVGFDTDLSYLNQPDVSPDQYFPLVPSGTTIQYWFFANGRRFMVVAKIGSVYLSCYCGFFLPYALPSEYPYPMFIACGGENADNPYNQGDNSVTGFWNPKSIATGSQSYGSNSVRLVDGSWDRMLNFSSTPSPLRSGKIWPNNLGGPNIGLTELFDNGENSYENGRNIDGSYVILPFVLYMRNQGYLLGELQDVFWVAGDQNITENTLTIGSDSYVMFQSANQSNNDEFAAFKVV